VKAAAAAIDHAFFLVGQAIQPVGIGTRVSVVFLHFHLPWPFTLMPASQPASTGRNQKHAHAAQLSLLHTPTLHGKFWAHEA